MLSGSQGGWLGAAAGWRLPPSGCVHRAAFLPRKLPKNKASLLQAQISWQLKLSLFSSLAMAKPAAQSFCAQSAPLSQPGWFDCVWEIQNSFFFFFFFFLV